MKTREVKVMCGIPGSGKSTWIKNNSTENSIIISRDAIRFQYIGNDGDYFRCEKEVFEEFIHQINEALNTTKNYTIYVDATHINKNSRAKLLSRLRPPHETVLTFEVINCGLQTCMERNTMRHGRAKVPDSAIKNMYNSFKAPTLDEFQNYKYGFKEIKINHHEGE